jgi:hypothetical protein
MYSIQYLTVLTFFGCEHVKTFDYKVYYVCLGTPRTKSRQGVGVHPCDVICPVALDHASLFKRL